MRNRLLNGWLIQERHPIYDDWYTIAIVQDGASVTMGGSREAGGEMIYSLWGKLCYGDHGEGMDLLYVEEAQEYVAEWAEGFEGKEISVRYWTATGEAAPEKMKRGAIKHILGLVEDDAGIKHHYSEYTGYLWTDENFVVGGHDVIAELDSHLGAYLLLEVELREK